MTSRSLGSPRLVLQVVLGSSTEPGPPVATIHYRWGQSGEDISSFLWNQLKIMKPASAWIISSKFLQTAVLQVRCWGERCDDRAAGGGGQHAGGGARDQGAGGLQQIPLHLPPRHRGQDCTGQLPTVILCIVQFSNLIYTLNSLSFVNVKFQVSRSFRSVKRVYYNLIVQMFNQFRDTGLPS